MTAPLLVATRFVPRIATRVGDRRVSAAAFPDLAGGLLGVAGAIHRGYPAYAGWLVVLGTYRRQTDSSRRGWAARPDTPGARH